ncbi:DUF397 domain-containing protein [Nocardia terpenica]|uniref:DUF397 domain-containing protein n=1 Tax=Nocardia terpenica TaxID=455432 RepID=A0A6G9Z5P2_9NOCA|nr:DUF397 domain-containing protein [Nocardia terpenica]QIS20486.1 DUF397 domain-containing protein [Nocardia terpenica]
MSIDLSEARWFKSSRSKDATACVEAAFLTDGAVGVRDSKNPVGPALVFAPGDWDAFTTGLKGGEFDPPRG